MHPCPQFAPGVTAVEDSRCGGIFGYLREDFFALPDLTAGKKIAFFTHPEHWSEHPVVLDIEKYRDSWRDGLLS